MAFGTTNLSAQLIINTLSDEDICQDITITLNNTVELTEDSCQFSTDYSNVLTGTNTLEVTSEIPAIYYTSTLDMVKVIKSIDEGFESYAAAMAADFDSDMVISTDDIVSMRRVIFGIDSELPTKVKLATVDQVFEAFTSLELSSDHTEISFDDADVQNGVATEVYVVVVGHMF